MRFTLRAKIEDEDEIEFTTAMYDSTLAERFFSKQHKQVVGIGQLMNAMNDELFAHLSYTYLGRLAGKGELPFAVPASFDKFCERLEYVEKVNAFDGAPPDPTGGKDG